MTILINDRDVLIQNTVPRSAIPTDRALLLVSSGQIFKVSAAGAGSPAQLAFQAKLLNMVGTVAWSASGGSVLTVDGNTAVLKYADMKGSETTVVATVTVDGQPYTSSQVITKVADGVMGNSARRAYSKSSLVALAASPSTLTTEGDSSYPPLNSWGAGTVWDGSPPALGQNERLFQSDGIYSPLTNTTSWTLPYLSSLKVGELSAITANLGKVTSGDVYGTVLHGGPGYAHASYSWPDSLQGGFHLSADGLLLGNPLAGKYFQITGGGELYAPGLSIANGGAIFSGSLAAVTGTIGLLRSRTTGNRMEISGDVLKCITLNNNGAELVTVQLGNLDL